MIYNLEVDALNKMPILRYRVQDVLTFNVYTSWNISRDTYHQLSSPTVAHPIKPAPPMTAGQELFAKLSQAATEKK